MRPESWRQKHAVVIGSGFGGLAAAVRLGARGYRVTVLERLDQPGGRPAVFRQDGFTFDAGPTIITAPFLFEELWALCGRKFSDEVELRALDHFYRIVFDDGGHFDCMADAAAMKDEVARISPGDVEGYERFMRHSEAIFRIGFEKLGHVPFGSLMDMVRIAPALVEIARRSQRLCDGREIRAPSLSALRIELSSALCRRQSVSHNFDLLPDIVSGAPLGRSFRRWAARVSWCDGLVRLIEGQGNSVRCGHEVKRRLLIEEGRASGVRLASGERIAADIVVSNADAAWTYRELSAEITRRRWTDDRLEQRPAIR